jgi:opacity protein-like surface antigen
MRGVVLTAVMAIAATGAQAADMPDFLRGGFTDGLSHSVSRWDGFYAGGSASYSTAAGDFSRALTGQTNFIYRDSTLEGPTSQLAALGNTNTQGTGFGGFAGYNWQLDDVVLGVEANYNWVNLTASSKGSIGPLLITNPPGETPPPNTTDIYSVTVAGAASAQVKDMVTFRGRAGWACDDFLPYMFGGLAVGRMDVSRSVSTTTTKEQITTSTDLLGRVTTTTIGPGLISSLSLTDSQERTNNYVLGWTAGLGFEYRLYGGLFMRAEYEHVQFVQVENIGVTLNTGRVGLGYKF